MNKFLEGAKQCRYTMFHPVNGFDAVKWEKKGSPAFCVLILLAFFLTNVFDQVLTGFIFNSYNPDKISVFSVFLITMICHCLHSQLGRQLPDVYGRRGPEYLHRSVLCIGALYGL